MNKNSQDFPLQEVPQGQRKSVWSLLWVLTGFTFFSATMFAGARIGGSFNFFPDLILVILLGNLLLGSYVAVLGYIAAKTGLNTVLLARFSFGDQGSKLVDLVLGLTQVLWYAWGTGTIAEILARYTGIDSQTFIYALMVFFGLAFCWTAFIGYRGLERLSIVAVPLMFILIIVSIVIASRDAGGFDGLQSLQGTGDLTVATAIAVIVGTFVSGGTQSTNWTRFASKPSSAVWTALFAFLFVNGLMVFMGAYGSLIYQQADIADILVTQGLLVLGIMMLFLNIWTTQDNTIYNFSVAGSNFFRTDRRKTITLAGALIGTIVALLGFHNAIVPFTLFLSTFIPPIGGILIADFFVVHRGKYPLLAEAGNTIQSLNFVGLLSYVGGCLIAFYSPFVPPLMGVIAGFVLYSALSMVMNMNKIKEGKE